MSGQLPLREWYQLKYDAKLITEARKNEGAIIVPALLQRADIPNSNGRIYPRAVLERELDKYQQIIESGSAYGELDHPATDPVVNLKDAAIAIREARWDGNEIKGRVEVLHRVPAGQILVGLMEHGMSIGISSRGVGSTIQAENGHELVDDDYTLLCFDAVSIGSVDGAGLLRESLSQKQVVLAEGFSLDRILKEANAKNIGPSQVEKVTNILNEILGV